MIQGACGRSRQRLVFMARCSSDDARSRALSNSLPAAPRRANPAHAPRGLQRHLPCGPRAAHPARRCCSSLPDAAQMRVAQQARVGPFLDVAAAAAHLHGVARDVARIAAGAEFEQRREDAQQRLRLGHRRRRRVRRRFAVWNTMDASPARTRTSILMSCRRISGSSISCLPKATRFRATKQRLVHGAAHHAGGAHAVGEARLLIMSAICLKPACGSPISQATRLRARSRRSPSSACRA